MNSPSAERVTRSGKRLVSPTAIRGRKKKVAKKAGFSTPSRDSTEKKEAPAAPLKEKGSLVDVNFITPMKMLVDEQVAAPGAPTKIPVTVAPTPTPKKNKPRRTPSPPKKKTLEERRLAKARREANLRRRTVFRQFRWSREVLAVIGDFCSLLEAQSLDTATACVASSSLIASYGSFFDQAASNILSFEGVCSANKLVKRAERAFSNTGSPQLFDTPLDTFIECLNVKGIAMTPTDTILAAWSEQFVAQSQWDFRCVHHMISKMKVVVEDSSCPYADKVQTALRVRDWVAEVREYFGLDEDGPPIKSVGSTGVSDRTVVITDDLLLLLEEVESIAVQFKYATRPVGGKVKFFPFSGLTQGAKAKAEQFVGTIYSKLFGVSGVISEIKSESDLFKGEQSSWTIAGLRAGNKWFARDCHLVLVEEEPISFTMDAEEEESKEES